MEGDGMDTEEFLTWAAYSQIEPFIENRTDGQTAMLMAQQYNMNRGKGRPGKKPKDFYPQWYAQPRRAQTMDEMERAMKMRYLAMGGDPKKLTT